MATCSPEETGHWAAAAQLLVEGVPPVFRLDVLKARRWVCVAVEDELVDDAAAQLRCPRTAASGAPPRRARYGRRRPRPRPHDPPR